MSYKHILVADTNTHQPQFFHYHTLQLFCEELTKQMRGVKTTPRDAKSQWVYVDGELFARGWVGYGDFQTSRHGDNKFAVCARGIENCKYSEGSQQYHMKVSLAMAPTLKVAKRNLTKYTTHEVESVLRPIVRDHVKESRDKVQNKYRGLLSDLGVTSYGRGAEQLRQELKHLVTSGHTFHDPVFGHTVQRFTEVSKEMAELPDGVPMDFVHIYPTPWETRADVLAVRDALTTYGHTPTQLTWVADELPDNVMGKVAVMQMCEDGQYVADVGFRINEHTFYLHKESDDTWK